MMINDKEHNFDISLRLKSVTKYLHIDDHIGDIGSDHGELPIFLALNGYKFLYASDNKRGPYQHLITNIKKFNLGDKIRTKLVDGLEQLPDDIDTICILGMGGNSISYILKSQIDRVKKLKKIIVSPQSEVDDFRKFLEREKFNVVDEFYVEENKKAYPIMLVDNSDFVEPNFKDYEYWFGRFPILNRDPVLLKFITKEYERYSTLPMIVLRREDIKNRIDKISYLLSNWYKSNVFELE